MTKTLTVDNHTAAILSQPCPLGKESRNQLAHDMAKAVPEFEVLIVKDNDNNHVCALPNPKMVA